MTLTLGNVDAEAYQSSFREASRLLRLRKTPRDDVHDLSHASVERYFLTHGVDTLEQCVELTLMSIGKKPLDLPVKRSDLVTEGEHNHVEATLDLYKLYLKASDRFTSEEKIVFFSLLDGNPLSGIAQKLKLSPSAITEIRKSLLEKIKNAIPST